jgi:MSHA pilin protein MshD
VSRDRHSAAALARKRQSGVTILELVIAIVVVGIALGGTMLTIEQAARRSADPMLQRQAISIAEAYLEEILQKDFLDPDDETLCPTAEATRDLYDNVCDYDNLDDTGARNQAGTAASGLSAYRIEIDIDTTATLGSLTSSADVIRVDARVTDPMGRTLLVSGYRTGV